jgi:hypothetical protein
MHDGKDDVVEPYQPPVLTSVGEFSEDTLGFQDCGDVDPWGLFWGNC